MPRPRAVTPTRTLVKRGARWYVQWWDGESGIARRVSCRTERETEARVFLETFKVVANAPPVPGSPTIGAILDAYETDRARTQHSPTLGYDVAALKRHLEYMPVDLMNAEQSEQYWKARRGEPPRAASAKYRKRPRPLSDGTLIRELGTLRTALTWAVREKWITEAPYVSRPGAPPSRDRWLTPREYERLQVAAKAPHVRLYIALAAYTGARMGAILDLTWDRVDLDLCRINMGEGRGRKRRATVPIVGPLMAELKAATEGATSAYVIERGGEKIASIKAGIRATAERAGIKGVTPHVFRHTAATWMVQRGVPFPMVAAWLGNSAAMVEKVYGHHSPEWLAQAAEALSRPLAEKTKSATKKKVS